MHLLRARARDHLNAIAQAPRPAGSPADAAARRYCARFLEGEGFAVREQAFDYSEFPGRYGTPVVGLIAAGMLLRAAWLGWHGEAARGLGILIGAALSLGLFGWWLGSRGVLDMPAFRARGVNLVATRDGLQPRVWLMAHTDSKSQPISSGVRAAGVILLILAAAGLGLLTTLEGVAGITGLPGWTWGLAAAAAILGGIPVGLSTVGAGSPGAVDNASGLVAVLMAAAQVPQGTPVGVVITAAEELGLAGARAWARAEPRRAVVLNCDGVDDVGMLTGMYTGRRARRVLEAFAAAARDRGVSYRSLRLIPGILVDAVAVAAAGFETATLSRGTLATLGRIHTGRDSLAYLDGDGIPEAAAVLASAATRLATQGDA